MSLRQDVARLRAELLQQGFTVIRQARHCVLLRAPGGGIVGLSLTPSDRRAALQRMRSDARRAGAILR